MITLHLSDPDGEREPLVFPDMTLAGLMRTIRPVGERFVFVEPRPGMLVNLAHVEVIYDSEAGDAAADEDELRRELAEQ